MPVDEPWWWYAADVTTMQWVLGPVARVWGYAAERRVHTATPVRAALPVVCVGNFTAGGTGKTPLAIHIARTLMVRGERPAFLTRGYRGRHKAPHLVDLAHDTADDVGDEPLLLARVAPTVVARDRAEGAAALASLGGASPPTVIVMDDGLQNPGLAKDLTIAVVDGRRGFGNGCVIPAGPLRAPLAFQLGLADAILINQATATATTSVVRDVRRNFAGPVIEAGIEPDGDAAKLRGARVLALAGIGNPARFHDLLVALGADVVERRFFPDHHAFSANDAGEALARAATLQAKIVTTEKDWVRLIGATGPLAELRESAMPVPIRLRLGETEAARLSTLLDAALTNRRAPPS